MTVRVTQGDIKKSVPLAAIGKGEGFLAVESQRLYIRIGVMIGNCCKCARLTPSHGDYMLEGDLRVYRVNLNIEWELA